MHYYISALSLLYSLRFQAGGAIAPSPSPKTATTKELLIKCKHVTLGIV